MWDEFIIDGNFIISDFLIEKMRIRITVDNTNPKNNLDLIAAGYAGNPILIDKFKLKQVDYSIENNYINFDISGNVEHSITYINIFKFFKENEGQIINMLLDELNSPKYKEIGLLVEILDEDITLEDLRTDRPERWKNY